MLTTPHFVEVGKADYSQAPDSDEQTKKLYSLPQEGGQKNNDNIVDVLFRETSLVSHVIPTCCKT